MANKTCGECKNYGTPKNCICIFAEETYPAVEKGCKDFEPKPKPTNGDRIQQMSNKELAEFLIDAADDIVNNNRSKDDVIAWLNAPADCVKQNGNHDTQTDLCNADNTESEDKDE